MSKAAKYRFCPALQREITSADCGDNRGTRYNCPADCSFSPFALANYDALLKVETATDDKTLELFEAELKKNPELNASRNQARYSISGHALHAFVTRALFFQRAPDGTTLADRWRQKNYTGLKNDERFLFQAKCQTRVALVEIHRVIDGQQILGVDLLAANPSPMIFRDRAMAARACRFSVLLTWIYPLPHYWRITGTAMVLSEFGQFEPLEILRETARHLGCPEDENGTRQWLAENFVRVDESISATARMRKLRAIGQMDYKFGKAVYEWRAPFADCREALDEASEVEFDDLSQTEADEGFAEARQWTDFQGGPKTAGAPFVLGRVVLGQSHARLEAFGQERLVQLRERFERLMGGKAAFVSERLDDLGGDLIKGVSEAERALIPPKLLENLEQLVAGQSRLENVPEGTPPEEMERMMRAADARDFLQSPIPALDNFTPVQAAQTPELRPKLIRLLKQRVKQVDEINLESGGADDINWMLRELGLTEIIFDPPPPRARLPERIAGEDFADDDFIDDTDFPLPVLPVGPLTSKEVGKRFDAMDKEFRGPELALRHLEDCGSLVVLDATELCLREMAPGELGRLAPFIAMARLLLVPRGHREPELNFERMDNELEVFYSRLNALEPQQCPVAVRELINNSRQPKIAELLTSMLFGDPMPKSKGGKESGNITMLIILVHLVNELDQSIREESAEDRR